MRVLHLCPLWFPISADAHGGIETFLPGLLSTLRQHGCENTIIASGDSRTASKLLAAVPFGVSAGMERGEIWEYAAYEQNQLRLAVEHGGAFDIIHSHIGWGAYVLSSIPALRGRVLHTQHNPITPDLEWLVRQCPDLIFSAVSEFQARKLKAAGVQCCTVIPNGVDVSTFTFRPEPGEGLVFVGRMEQEKGPDLAVETARALGFPLRLAGPIVDHDFFEAYISPFLDDRIRYVGVVDHAQKDRLYGGAACALVPSRWDEPFGLVAIEAMACGTPVVALRRGALPDIVESGLTGFTVDSEADLAGAVSHAIALDRSAVRSHAQDRFEVSRSAVQYLDLYGRMLSCL